MTGTTIPAHESVRDNFKEVVQSSTAQPSEMLRPVLTAGRLRNISATVGTGAEFDQIGGGEARYSPVERVYPHVFDEETPAGQARIFILKALGDALVAIEAFGDVDLTSVSTRLGLIAASMAAAHPLTDFNESLGAVVSFVRRATLAASSADVSRGALNALVHVLQMVGTNPMIDLEEAAGLVDELSHEGWHGEHGVAQALVAALFEQAVESEVEVQAQLFDETQPQSDEELGS